MNNVDEFNRPYVIRYVVTHIGKNKLRTLIGPAQGRVTYATQGEAENYLTQILKNNPRQTLEQCYGLPLQVRACHCWPGHFDPQGIYFDTETQGDD